MSNKTVTTQDVSDWIAVNVRRRKVLRLLCDSDIARRMGCKRPFVTRILGADYPCMTLKRMLRIAKAMDMTLAELVSRPDDMSLLKQDRRKTGREIARKKAKIKQTKEAAAREALMESLGLCRDEY